MKRDKEGLDGGPMGVERSRAEVGPSAVGRPASWVRPTAPLTQPPPKNLDQALQRLQAQQPPHRYADHVASALRRMAEVIGKPPGRISTEPAVLRQLIADALPAKEEMSQKRWRRICSLVSTYLRTTGIDLEPSRSTAGHSAEWRDLLGRANRNVALATSRFASFCTRHGLEPDDVTSETFETFGEGMRLRSLQEHPEAIVRNTVTHWNRGASSVGGWPQLIIPQQRHTRFYSLPFDAYPESFGRDVDAFLSRSSNASIFSTDYKRPNRPSTVALRRRQFRLCAALLVESGFPIDKLTSLEVLTHPDNVEAALQRHVDRKAGKTVHSLVQLANLMARVAQTRRHDPAQVEILRIYAANAASSRLEEGGRSGMTKRNREALRQFDLAANRKALLTLPDRVFAEARAEPCPTLAQARRVMQAMAVELLLACAFRGANLVNLEVERHFSDERRGGSAIRYLLIPAAEMKGNEDFEVPLPDRTRALLDEYLSVYWPLLAPVGSLFLFPGKDGRLRDKIHFAQAIVAFILRETGLKMHLHLFRHFAVKLHLDHHPDDIETPRRFLQHKSSKTTLGYYTEVRSDRSFGSWHQTLESERNRGGDGDASRR